MFGGVLPEGFDRGRVEPSTNLSGWRMLNYKLCKCINVKDGRYFNALDFTRR